MHRTMTRSTNSTTSKFPNIAQALRSGESILDLIDKTTGESFKLMHDLSERERDVILAGGSLNYIKGQSAG